VRPQYRGAWKNRLLTHIREMDGRDSTLEMLHGVLPQLTRDQVRTLLKELQVDGLIRVAGRTKGSRWLPVDTGTVDDSKA
jgi:hypothetical protein